MPVAGTAVGGIAGALIGGIGAATTTYFYSVAGGRKQDTKVSFNNFQDSTKQMENIINDVNARHYSNIQANVNWDNEYNRVLQSERELKAQQKKLFGEKLSKSLDELSKVEAWLRRYDEFNAEFNNAKFNPDPTRIITTIADKSIQNG